jgi:hypothetical protein
VDLFSFIIASIMVLQKPQTEFKPERISQHASIELDGSINNVFPLFGPVLEKKWAEGWDPEIMYSTTGVVEDHMIFRTKAHDLPEDWYTWVITRYEPENFFIEYTVSTSKRMWFISIQCAQKRSKTIAAISYTYTGFSQEGNELNNTAMKKIFAHDLKDWEEAINYYLKNGKQFIR